jgi:hypothetical protein
MRRRLSLSIILTLLLSISFYISSAQLVINEFMASNTSVYVDPDYDESADWIEIFNSGTTPVQLKGYCITDNLKEKTKWKITSSVTIAAGQYLIIWADGNNVGLHTSFKLTASGEELGLVNPSGVVIDSIVFGNQDPNISMGRKTDGNSPWVFFTTPTPAQPNNTISYDGIVKNEPTFSIPGGIFHNTISLKLNSLYGGVLRYTLDGSEPKETSPVAGAQINITKNTVVRARIYKTDQVPGPVITNSYFIDLNNEFTDLPIVSISTDPDSLWDPVRGIYAVHSKKPDWEIPINIELFETDGRDKAAFNLPAGAKSTGLYSWQLPEKMLGISFRKEYGASKLEYPLIFDKSRKVYDTFSLRASGSDWGNTMFRDGMIQTSAVENTDLDISGFRPCVVYMNGEYMGVHNIREKIDEDYVVGNRGFEPGTFDMIEEVDNGINIENGDDIANNYFLSLTAKDLAIKSNYDAVAAEMDIEEFTEMVCTEVYSGNNSIGHNLMKYKQKDTGKWKWILMDFDRGFIGVNNELINFYINESGWPFKDLMGNSDYKKYFGKKLADLLFTTFNSERIIAEIENHKNAIEAEMPKHINRWAGTHGTGNYDYIYAIPSMDQWYTEIEVLKTFAKARPGVILNDLTNYGFQMPVPVTVETFPAKSGRLTFNGLKIPVDVCSGGYPQGEEIKLTVEAKAGYRFLGWQSRSVSLFAKEGIWKYSDTGTNLGTSWRNSDFSDTSWKSGQAEFGYGEKDEKTVISYGNDTDHRFITSYFRKTFVLNNKQDFSNLMLMLKCDDGAVVYLNGKEIVRYNLPAGEIVYGTTASSAIGGSDENDFHSFTLGTENLVNGNNIIAVEVHQSSANSSDVSFDMDLTANMKDNGQYISTNREYVVTPQSAINLTAVFESDGKCILPETISSALTLNKACSPYVVSSDVNITSTGKLTIPFGVEIWMSDGASIYSSGVINAKGTKSEPVIFKGNPQSSNKNWGFISIIDGVDTSRFSNVIIEDASRGERPREVGAITAYHSVVRFDSIHFDNITANPIATRFCDVWLTNSQLHSNIVGDLINVTRGKGYIENCEFIGNNLPDNDAIDFNGGADGVVKNCVIRDFFGINSDAIDMGERATNINLEGLYVHDITDKGVSVGQWSKVNIKNSLFTNCNMGAGIKDSSYASIDHCTFYGVGTPVNTYEKIVGRAGGNVKVTNSILSNAYEASYNCDKYSTIEISFSSSDNNKLPDGKHNIFVNPHFENPTFFDFSLLAGSSCIGSGSFGNMGSGLTDTGIEPEVMISDIAYYTVSGDEDLEFIGLYNPGNSRVDLSGYKFVQGITFTFPDGASVGPKEKVFVTLSKASPFWQGKGTNLFQWESGRLADEGEDIQLTNEVTTMIDEVEYNNKAPWPVPTSSGVAISLTRFDVDNHFGEYWKLIPVNEIVSTHSLKNNSSLTFYPNPSTGEISVSGLKNGYGKFEVFNLQGKLVKSGTYNSGIATIDLSGNENGMYLIRSGTDFGKVMLMK